MTFEIGFWVLELAIKSTLVFGLAWFLTTTVKKLAAEERHLVWTLAMSCALILPALSVVAPRIELPFTQVFVDAQRLPVGATSAPVNSTANQNFTGTAEQGNTKPTTTHDSLAGVSGEQRPLDRVLIALLAYLMVAAAILTYFAIGALRVSQRARSLPETTNAKTIVLVERARRQLGIRRSVRTLLSPTDYTPWASGLLTPVIVLPEEFASWPSEEQQSAVMHELSHIARLDHLTLWVGQLCCAVYWFQPLAWLAFAKMMRESERACDDRVLLAGASGSNYAQQLLGIANKIFNNRTRPMPITAMARSSFISERINSILDSNIRRIAMSKRKLTLAVLLSLGLVGPIATLKGQEDQIPGSDNELAQVVKAHLASDRRDAAIQTLVDWIVRDSDRAADAVFCSYCSRLLHEQDAATPNGEHESLRAALDEIEQRAVATANGEWLVRLANIAVNSHDRDAVNLGKHYLLQAHSIGNASDAAQWTGLLYLVEMGRLEDAEALVQRMKEDEFRSPGEATSLEKWSDYLATEVMRSNTISARLIGTAGAIDDNEEYLPVYKIAPVYPAEAAEARLEGSAVVEFTVTNIGRTQDIFVFSSTDSAFDQPSLDAAAEFRYAPRTVDGVAVEVPGVRNRIVYLLEPK